MRLLKVIAGRVKEQCIGVEDNYTVNMLNGECKINLRWIDENCSADTDRGKMTWIESDFEILAIDYNGEVFEDKDDIVKNAIACII